MSNTYLSRIKDCNEFNPHLFTRIELIEAIQHFETTYPIVLITVLKSDQQEHDNSVKTKHLLTDIKEAGFGYLLLKGKWVLHNEVSSKSNTCDSGVEYAALILSTEDDNGKLKRHLKGWLSRDQKTAALLKDTRAEEVTLLHADGRETEFGQVDMKSLGRAYCQMQYIQDREFVFDSALIEKNWIGKLAALKPPRNTQ